MRRCLLAILSLLCVSGVAAQTQGSVLDRPPSRSFLVALRRLGECLSEVLKTFYEPRSIAEPARVQARHAMRRSPAILDPIDSRVRAVALPVAILSACVLVGCQNSPAPLTTEVPLHLEEHLDAAVITASEAPGDVPEAVEWRFDEPQPDWKPGWPPDPDVAPATITRTEDALRVTLGKDIGGVSIELPDWHREDWAYIVVRARTSEGIDSIAVRFNRWEGSDPRADGRFSVGVRGDSSYVIRDGSVQTYLLRADSSRGIWKGPWRQLGIWFETDDPASIDILSVALTPKEARYAATAVGAV